MSVVLLAATSAPERARLGAALRDAGYDLQEAEPATIATREAELAPQLVLLDSAEVGPELPAILAALRIPASLPGPSILVLTDPGDDATTLAALAAGADDCLSRGSPVPLILARIGCLIERRRLTQHAALNERLSQVGRLVAGIVHEIRGPLSVIGGNAEVMLMSLPPDAPALLWAEPILRTSRLLQKRLEHLMAAVRSGPPALGAVDLADLAKEAVNLFVKGTDPRRSKIAVTPNFPPDFPPARADAGRILQVLINLLVNAHEAAAAHGAETAIQLNAAVHDGEGGRWITLEIRDNGPGIPDALLSRIFDAYFTTKPGGSGYGLYLAAEIVREHGGRLLAGNAPGGGASFMLWLPPAEPAAEAAPPGS